MVAVLLAVAERSRLAMGACEDPGRLARDAYTYLHAPIVAGIIAVAVGDDLLIARPGHALPASAWPWCSAGPFSICLARACSGSV